ncbi:MAG: DNA gyrase subunit A [Chloroflexota bacterium]
MEIGIVRPIAIEEEMQSSYLDYAMSVIVSRALPDVRDGLKPVHRRILVTLHDLGLNHTAHYRKSAKICGDVSGNYHPHGEAVVYPSMARLAQDFNMRYPLVDGQGNFGSVDGDNPAAMRYTEARMTAIAEELLADIDKNTVDWVDNYDGTRKEPVVLPTRVPNLLVNGSAGIAVGMATNIPPHNLGEICDATIQMINRFGAVVDDGVPFDLVWARVHGTHLAEEIVQAAIAKPSPSLRQKITAKAGIGPRKGMTTEALLAYVDDGVDIAPDELVGIVHGPDFPTGGLILGVEGIKSAYTTGHGRVVVRAKAHIEEMPKGSRFQIVVVELPYQVNKASLLEKIADLVRDKRIEGISDLRDESDRQGMRVVIELKRDAKPRQVLNALYKHTAMQIAFSVNMLALVDNQPRTLTLKAALLHFIDHRQVVVTRRTQYELDKARQRAHILEGLKVALDHLDAVISTIRKSRDADTARKALVANFKLSEIQAQAILEMQLRRLAALERQKILDELAEVKRVVAHLEDLLAHPIKILYVVRDELMEIKTKYGDPRRTRILAEEAEEIADADLIPDVEVVIGLTQRGYVRWLPVETYRPQRKARGAGTGAIVTREDDAVIHITVTNTHAYVLFFTNRGRVYSMHAYDIPEATRQSRGLPLGNFVNIDPLESVTAIVPVRSFDQGRHLLMLTRAGEIKRIELTDFAAVRTSGLIAMSLDEGDELRWVRRTGGDDELLIATEQGQTIRFHEDDVRVSSRTSGGVRAVRLDDGDHVAGMDVVGRGSDVLVATERGAVKRTAVSDYPVHNRGGGGVRGMKVTDKTGLVVALRVANTADEIMVATAEGIVYRSVVSHVPRMGRATSGVGLLKVAPNDHVVAVACLYANPNGAPGSDLPKGTSHARARAAEEAMTEPADETAAVVEEVKAAAPKPATTTKTPAKPAAKKAAPAAKPAPKRAAK